MNSFAIQSPGGILHCSAATHLLHWLLFFLSVKAKVFVYLGRMCFSQWSAEVRFLNVVKRNHPLVLKKVDSHGLAATAPIQTLAWELPYAVGAALKSKIIIIITIGFWVIIEHIKDMDYWAPRFDSWDSWDRELAGGRVGSWQSEEALAVSPRVVSVSGRRAGGHQGSAARLQGGL